MAIVGAPEVGNARCLAGRSRNTRRHLRTQMPVERNGEDGAGFRDVLAVEQTLQGRAVVGYFGGALGPECCHGGRRCGEGSPKGNEEGQCVGSGKIGGFV